MKLITVVSILAFCTTLSFSETGKNTVIATLAPSAPVTKIETALARKGRIIIKDVYNIAEAYGLKQEIIRFTAVCVYEPNQENSKLKALKMDIIAQHKEPTGVFLDSDEIPAFVKAIETLSTTAINWKYQNKEFTHVAYTTRSGLTIGFIQRALEQRAYLSAAPDSEKCFLPTIDSLKIIGDNASKCLTTLKEK